MINCKVFFAKLEFKSNLLQAENLLHSLMFLYWFNCNTITTIYSVNCSCSDILALPTLKEYIYVCAPNSVSGNKEWTEWEAKLNVMQATYLSIGAYPDQTVEALLMGCKVFKYLLQGYSLNSSEV